MKIQLLLSLLFSCSFLFAQEKNKEEDVFISYRETMPYLHSCCDSTEGGINELYACSQQKILHYVSNQIPEIYKSTDKCLRKMAVVCFSIDSIGKVDTASVMVLRSPNEPIAKIAKKIIQHMVLDLGDWQPALFRNKAIGIRYNVPIQFFIEQ